MEDETDETASYMICEIYVNMWFIYSTYVYIMAVVYEVQKVQYYSSLLNDETNVDLRCSPGQAKLLFQPKRVHIFVLCYRLCIVLLTKKIAEHDVYRDSFREFAVEHSHLSDRVRFAYVYEDTQSPFVKSVTWGRGAVNDTLGSLKVNMHYCNRVVCPPAFSSNVYSWNSWLSLDS